MKKVLLFLGLFFIGSTQDVFAQVTVDIQLAEQNAEVLYLNDLDLTNPGQGRILFWVKITNGYSEDRYIALSIMVESGQYGILAEGRTKPFWIRANEVIYIDNRNLSEAGSRFELETFTITDAASELTSAILASGRLPNDTYRFLVTVEDVENPQESSSDEEKLTITNPTTLELVSPGARVGEGELPVIYTTLPQFVWESNASEFIFTVCEKLPSNNSPEDVMENEPRYQARVTERSLIYPSSGAYPLEEGHTYYWQVKAVVQTSSGPVELKSEIWGFQIGSVGQSALQAQMTMLQNILRSLIGEDAVNQMFSEGGELFGATYTGVIRFNGRSISLQELQAMVQRGEIEAVDFFIE
jgi:hypothetical protein